MATTAVPQRELLRTQEMAQRYGVHPVTIAEWVKRDGLGFPRPLTILGRKYWKRSELEAWEDAQKDSESSEAAVA